MGLMVQHQCHPYTLIRHEIVSQTQSPLRLPLFFGDAQIFKTTEALKDKSKETLVPQNQIESLSCFDRTSTCDGRTDGRTDTGA